MSLKKFVKQHNDWNAIFGTPLLDINNPQDRQVIARKIDCDLSPENLSCDGELSRSQVQARYNLLTKAARELKAIDPTVKFYEYSA